MATPLKKCCGPDPAPLAGIFWAYVDSSGYYINPNTFARVQVLNYAGGAPALIYNKCIHIQTVYAFGTNYAPIDCPCCPNDIDYYYMESNGLCMPTGAGGKGVIATPPVPCIACVCIDPIPFTCPVDTPSETNAFQFDFTQRYCEDCNTLSDTVPGCGEANFIPKTYYDPAIIFILKNRNLI